MALLVLAVAVAVALAAPPAPAAVPAGCDAARPAVAHDGGTPAQRLIPCRYYTGARSMEPSFGFAADGRVLFQGWAIRSGTGFTPYPIVMRAAKDLSSWEDVSPIGPVNSLDPYLEVDDRTGRAFSVNYLGGGQCSSVSTSDDAGDTWITSPVAGCAGFDGQSIAAGPPVTSSPVGYADLVYYCTGATPGSAAPATTPFCSKSIDGGLAFVPTGQTPWPLADEGAEDDVFGPWAGNPAVGPDGTLYIPKRFAGQPELAVSHDEGATWTRGPVAANGASGATPRIALNARGDVFVAYLAADHQPYLVSSRDGARTWSAPLRVSPPGVREAALPWPAVRGDARVAVAYLASTNATGQPPFFAYCNYLLASDCPEGNYDGVQWNGYLTVIDDAFAAAPALQTATVNPPEQPLFVGGCSADGACKANLDFIDADFGPDGDAYAAFVDDCRMPRDFLTVFGQDFGGCSDSLGEGVLARLTVSEQTGPAAALGLPSARSCASRRHFAIRLRAPRGVRLRSARVYVNGRRVRVVRGARLRADVDLRGLPRGTVRVTIVARTTRGRTLRSTRRYRTCVPRGG